MLDAGIVDDDIDAAEHLVRHGEQCADLDRFRHVRAVEADLNAVLSRQPVADRGDLAGVAEAVEHHIHARLGESFGHP